MYTIMYLRVLCTYVLKWEPLRFHIQCAYLILMYLCKSSEIIKGKTNPLKDYQ